MLEPSSYGAAMSEIPRYRRYCRASGCAVWRGARWEGRDSARRAMWFASRAQGSPAMKHCVLRGWRRAALFDQGVPENAGATGSTRA